MQYKITAKVNEETLKDFYTKLADGTIASQKPDGEEMVTSMKCAKIDADKIVTWYENCFCAIPLNHERTTVYDQYFYDFTPKLVKEVKNDIEGVSFWEYMAT